VGTRRRAAVAATAQAEGVLHCAHSQTDTLTVWCCRCCCRVLRELILPSTASWPCYFAARGVIHPLPFAALLQAQGTPRARPGETRVA
jgi:hypothetical protein